MTRYDVKESGFTGTVRADQSDELALLYGERHTAQGFESTEILRYFV
jgi:hypothetical protein